MSLPLNKLFDKFSAAAVLLAIIVGTGLALWLGGKTPPDLTQALGQHPHFDYNFPLLPEIIEMDTSPAQITGIEIEPFWQNRPDQIEPEDLSLRELTLGLIVVSTTERYCLSNGTMMSEGMGSGRFTVDTITEEGVWYESAADRFFLQVGERVYIDFNGRVHLENKSEPNKQEIHSNNGDVR